MTTTNPAIDHDEELIGLTNKSDSVFQDGDLITRPGESVQVVESRARVLLRDYAWQFSKGGSGATETEVQEATANYENPVVEHRATGHTEETVADDGKRESEAPSKSKK